MSRVKKVAFRVAEVAEPKVAAILARVATMALTARQVQTAGPGKHADGRGNGLWLKVSPTGARRWFVRVVVAGKRREMSLGSYPRVPLAEARERAEAAQRVAEGGLDPIEQREQQATREAPKPTFTAAAARFIRSKRRGWANRKHARQWAATLRTYAKPVIGDKAVDTIATEDILAILQPIWAAKTETAKRVQGRIENILDYSAAMKWCDATNPARWRGHLDKLLPAATKVKRQANGGATKHHPAMPYHLVPSFMAEVAEAKGTAAAALRFLILTATRTGEVLGATWAEIDMAEAVWTIPPARMKAKREHRVPLSDAALAILESLPRIDGEPWVFAGGKQGRPLSNMALLKVMRARGYGVNGARGDYVPHGFRSSFRDWAGDVSSYPANVAEAALAHVIGDKTVAAYARGDLFAKRRRMMADWAEWCTREPATVADLSEHRVRAAMG